MRQVEFELLWNAYKVSSRLLWISQKITSTSIFTHAIVFKRRHQQNTIQGNLVSNITKRFIAMQFFKFPVFMALIAAAIATPIQLESRSLFGCYRDVAATQVDCLEACGDTSATDCTNAWYV